VHGYRSPTQQKVHVQRGKDELKILFESGNQAVFQTIKIKNYSGLRSGVVFFIHLGGRFI